MATAPRAPRYTWTTVLVAWAAGLVVGFAFGPLLLLLVTGP